MRPAPLYLKLKEQIKGDLLADHARGESGTLAPLNELQVRYDASRPTISKALTALAAEGLLVKQAGRGMFALSPTLSSDTAMPRVLIGYIAPLTSAELPQNVYHGIDRIAQRRNCRVLIASAGNDVQQERMAAHEMVAAGVRGLIIYPTVRTGSSSDTDYLSREKLPRPIVLIDTCTPEQGHAQVRFDNRRAGYQMTQMMIATGHKSVGVITFSDSLHHPSLEARLSGHLQAVQDLGGANAPQLIQRISTTMSAADIDNALDIMMACPTPPTAIVAGHDPIAAQITLRLLKRDIRVPDDVEVAGFDNAREFRHFQPKFTTSNPDFDSMGEVAAEMLLDAIQSNTAPTQTYILPVPILRAESPIEPAAASIS